MLKTALAAISAVLVIATIASVAFARTVTNHPSSGTSRIATISATKTFPAPGSSSLGAGINQISPGGRSASILATKITGTTPAGGVTFTSRSTDYTPNGLEISIAKGTAAAKPDGTTVLKGTGSYTGGTGKYRGLRGSYSFTGTAPKPTGTEQTVITLQIKGNLRY